MSKSFTVKNKKDTVAQSGGPKLKSTSPGDLHVKRQLNPKSPNTRVVLSITSDLSVSPYFGVVYCIMGLLASTLGGTLRGT